jgi:hypothetical protein
MRSGGVSRDAGTAQRVSDRKSPYPSPSPAPPEDHTGALTRSPRVRVRSSCGIGLGNQPRMIGSVVGQDRLQGRSGADISDGFKLLPAQMRRRVGLRLRGSVAVASGPVLQVQNAPRNAPGLTFVNVCPAHRRTARRGRRDDVDGMVWISAGLHRARRARGKCVRSAARTIRRRGPRLS